MLFSPVFVESHPCRSLDPFAGLTSISYPLKPNSLRLNLFADPHPLNLYATIFYKKAGGGRVFLAFKKHAPLRYVTKKPSQQLLYFPHLQTVTPVSPLESALTQTAGSHPSSQ